MNDRRRRRRRDYQNPQEAAEAAQDIRAVLAYEPHNANAEAAVIGGIMLDNNALTTTASFLNADHFFVPAHARIFSRMQMLIGQGAAANPVTLGPYFEGERITHTAADGEILSSTYVAYMLDMIASNAALLGLAGFVKQVFDLAMLRDVASAARDAMKASMSGEDDVDRLDPANIIAGVETRFGDISDAIARTTKRKGKYFSEAFTAFRANATAEQDGTSTSGITITGYSDWNDVCGKMGGGDLIYLGGRPSMGKTGVACAVATGAALGALESGADTAVEFLSLEMKEALVSQRMIANMLFEQGVTSTYREQKKGNFTAADLRALDAIEARMADVALHVDDPDKMMVEDLLPWIRRRKRAWAVRGKTLRLVVIDYLSLLDSTKDFRSPQEKLSHISKLVKRAAREADVAIVALTQLSRALEAREDKRPMLSDLRDSGSLEQDADVVIFVYRDEYYLERSEPAAGSKKYEAWRDDMLASRDRLELIGAKARESALVRRTGYFFANEQAVRGSDFYQTADMFADAPF